MNRKSLILILLFVYLSCSRSEDLNHRLRLRRESPKIDGSCAPPEIENGQFEVLGKDYKQGNPIPNYGILKITCKQDLVLYPARPVISCRDGNWDVPVPKCISPEHVKNV